MSVSTGVQSSSVAQSRQQRTFLGHPVGLYVLFFTEMWERFSYYGMRALLILYMVNYFKWSQENASTVYKWYTSLVYLTPLVGGFLADRYLGNRRAVIIGAVLMAIGHFLMAFEPLPIFYAALVFLILGNGFFKPNMSTQVGRLYPRNDARRDGAYTIFYMGVNLGAFLSPLVCGWLAENTLGQYHSGFTAAGIGMVCGLAIYLLGQRWILEIDQSGDAPVPVKAEKAERDGAFTAVPSGTVRPEDAGGERIEVPGPPPPISEREAETTPSALPRLNHLLPRILALLGVAAAVIPPLLALPPFGLVKWNTVISFEIAAVCALISAWITTQIHHALRDRVLAIYIVGIFVVFFWAAFEQAGNAMNLWADKVTDRYLTTAALPPDIYPKVTTTTETTVETERVQGFWERWGTLFQPLPKAQSEASASAGESWTGIWNPVPTAWFQSINALAIFLLAPLFAFLRTYLDRRGLNPSIPTKMALGVLLMSLAFGLMIGAAQRESQPSQTALPGVALGDFIKLNADNQLCAVEEGQLQPYQAGRLLYDPSSRTLRMTGVLPDIERDRIVRDTAPASFKKAVAELQEKSEDATARSKAQVHLDEVPPGLDLRYAGFREQEVQYDPATQTLSTTIPLADKDVKALLVAAGEPRIRAALDDLYVHSSAFRVSSWWLFWFYIFSTLGELCLSPVGLSMVSKLAPAKFATMLMGLWMLTSFFGNFAAGAFGEVWGTVAPLPYFCIFLAALGLASLVLFVLVRKVVALMHGVN